MTGIELITKEREEQLNKHGFSVEGDSEVNCVFQLGNAASTLCLNDGFLPADLNEVLCPEDWNTKYWIKMINKSYKNRLIIAGALIAAEIDRLQYEKENN